MADDPEYLDPSIYDRPLLKLDPSGSIAIKRDVHDLELDGCSALDFAGAFHETMRAVGKEFGLIKVVRTKAETGQPFKMGSRFQGQYQIEDALRAAHQKGFVAWIERHVPGVIEKLGLGKLLRHAEDAFTSDYGVITTFDLASPTQPTMTYEYLEGSPIAGSSTFLVTPTGAKTCRFTQIFLYQELHPDFVLFFSMGGLKLHDQVVYSQVKQSADLLGARITSTDIPPEYVTP
jgi:hypothetical protein